METDTRSILLVKSSVANSETETVSEKLSYKSVFKRKLEVADITINPPRMIDGVAPETQNWFKCYICKKVSAVAVYECTDEHVVCDGCHPLLKRPICRFVDEDRKAVCRKPLRLSPSKALSNVLRNSTFSCINPACQDIVGGGENWIPHLLSCRNDNLACPDHRCNYELIQKKDFIQHLQESHHVELQTEGPYFFQFEKPLDPSSPESVSVVCLIKVMDHIMYVAAQFVSSRCVLLCCFLLDRDVEFVKMFKLEIAPAVKKPADMMVRVTTRINLPGRDMNEVKHFGRSAIFIIPELDSMFGFNKSAPQQMYRFSLKFKDTGGNMAGLPCLEGLSWESQVLGSNSGWGPIPQEALAKLEVNSKGEEDKERQKAGNEKFCDKNNLVQDSIANAIESKLVDRHHFKYTDEKDINYEVYYHVFVKDSKSERISNCDARDKKIIPVKPVNPSTMTHLLQARRGRKI